MLTQERRFFERGLREIGGGGYNRVRRRPVLRFFDKYREEVTTMELLVLLECLKLLWLGFEVVKHFISRKREKAMIEALESLNHRLMQLEKTKEKP